MKKITLLFVALFVGALTFGQVIDRQPDEGGTGLISVKGSDGGVFSADYFVLQNEVTLGTAVFYGFSQGDGTGDMSAFITGFNVYIFADNDGVPDGDPESGGALYALADIDPANFTATFTPGDGNTLGDTKFEVDFTQANGGESITLEPGAYWISAFPTVNTGMTDQGRWNWFEGNGTPDNASMLIDPTNAFGAGTDWGAISDLIQEPFNSFAWTLFSDEMGVQEVQATNFMHYNKNNTLFLNSESQIGQVAVYNLLGQQVLNNTIDNNFGQLDLTNLTPGVYLAKVAVNGRTKSFKFVKQ